MAVSNLTVKLAYSGDGAQVTFAIPFQFITGDAATEVKAKLYDENTGEETLLVYPTDFTFDDDDAPANIIAVVPPTNSQSIVVYRVLPLTQIIDYINTGYVALEDQEKGLDRIVMMLQQIADSLASAPLLSDFDTLINTVNTALGPLTPGYVIGANDAGTGLEWRLIPDASSIDDAVADAEAFATAAAASASGASTAASSAAGSATAAGTNATNAASSAVDAAASAALAQLAADGFIFRDVVYITSVDSPVAVGVNDRGKLYHVDATGGNVVFTLPQISTINFATPYTIAIKKTDSGGNTVTTNRSSTDVIDGATSKVISTQNGGGIFVPDTSPTPDEWTTLNFGASAAGTVSGPGSSTAGNIPTFADTTGTLIQDSGVLLTALAPKASPTFTGTVTIPTPSGGDNTTKAASTAYVQTEIAVKAPLASPTFTGVPVAPTAAAGTNTTQLATTAFIQAALTAFRKVGTFSGTSITPDTVAMQQTWVYTGGSAQNFTTTGFGTISSLVNGMRFTVLGSSDTNTLTIAQSDITDGRLMNGDIILGKGKYITFEYNSTLTRMVEVERSQDA